MKLVYSLSLISLSLVTALQLAGCSDSSFSGGKTTGGERPTNGGASTGGNQPGADGTVQDGEPNSSSSSTSEGDPVAEVPTDDALSSIDLACQADQVNKTYPIVFPPIQSTVEQTVPSACRAGIEFNNFQKKTLVLNASNTADGSQTFKLEVDLATYQAPDTLRLVAVDAQGAQHVIFSSCRMRSANVADPTDGKSRPGTDVIRFFRPVLPKGTKSLIIDFSQVKTPTYMKITGLCDFLIPADNAANTRPTSN